MKIFNTKKLIDTAYACSDLQSVLDPCQTHGNVNPVKTLSLCSDITCVLDMALFTAEVLQQTSVSSLSMNLQWS